MRTFLVGKGTAALLALSPILLHSQNVGIGTAVPAEKLHVAGNLRVDFLAGADTRIVATDANGSLLPITSGTPGEVLTQTAGGPSWGSPSANAWNITGNTGTDVATNFVGTTDLQGLAFRTNNLERARFTDAGLLCVNGTGPFATDRFSAYASGNEYAVNGYASGTGAAGYFESTGPGVGLLSYASGTNGTAARFVSLSGSATTSPAVYVYNATTQNAGLYLRSDVVHNLAHGISVDINGAGANRGIQVDMDAANSGNGLSVLQYGLGHGVTVQTFNAANTLAGLYSDQGGTGRSVEGKTFLATHVGQSAYFVQASSGLLPATYANATAVWGQSSGIRGGAFLSAGASASNTCLQGVYNGPAGGFDGIGVLGVFSPSAGYGYGVVGQGNWYGVFANGNLGASGVKSFIIDHPDDPENKFLKHFSVESPEVLNLYRGSVTLNSAGEAVVTLPSYFHSINKDFSYHLTPVGKAANLFVAEEINATGEFRIGGGNPGQKVCWTVVADRNDAFMKQHPEDAMVEPLKKTDQKGKYYQPELHGQPSDKGMFEGNTVKPSLVHPSPSPSVTRTEQAPPAPPKKR